MPLLRALLFLLTTFATVSSNEHDAAVLLRVKTQFTDSSNILTDWTGTKPCNWTGISCHKQNNTVYSINLDDFNITSHFPFNLCLISSLRHMSLANNYLYGNLDSLSLATCQNLVTLNLAYNCFASELPSFNPMFTKLETLDLSGNNFTGKIPPSFGNLSSLKVLLLSGNFINGTVPEFLTNLTELTRLELGYNPLSPGQLPRSIGRLKKIETILIQNANLVGDIPESIGELKFLTDIDLSSNNISGGIPESIGGSVSLEIMELYDNKLSGGLPESLSNLSLLRELDVSENNLSGKIPESVAGMGLSVFHLNDNGFEGVVPDSLALNANLSQLKLFNNKFSGKLPEDLGRNSEIVLFDVSGNEFEGMLPWNLCSGNKLEILMVMDNYFSGNIPESYGNCTSLGSIRMNNNKLSGEVPVNFWSLSKLAFIQLENNEFEGAIPSSICKGLNELLISGNKFSGEIPVKICETKDLVVLDLSRNRFSGQLPKCLTNLKKLQKLELQENEFEGELPNTVSSWKELNELNMSNNKLTGKIPYQLGDLPVLTYLSLEKNSLSGEIPLELTKLKLNKFNISNNKLEGKVPVAFDNANFLPSLIGNRKLCSPNLEPLRSCTKTKPINFYIVTVLSALVLLLILSILWIIRTKTYRIILNKKQRTWTITSFQRLDFDEDELLAALTKDNLIGSGSSGQVYKVRLKNGQLVAVKRLYGKKNQDDRESVFEAEVETLGKIRHANVVKLLMSCTEEEFKILVYEYMENGSLGDLLHNEKGLLDWPIRYDIAIGAAQGLAYLHHDCGLPIVHRDIKSNNILLDGDFRARVADFGLAKVLKRVEEKGDMSRIAGSYGYIAPEYSYTMKVNERSDIYSYGVVLMELITGKRPTDDSFGENKDIVKWVTEITLSFTQAKYKETNSSCINAKELIDPRMNPLTIDYEEVNNVLRIALLCTSAFPMNRPSMRHVIDLLKDRKFTTPK